MTRPAARMLRGMAAGLALAATLAASTFAVEPEERLDDPALEARARAISQELRCVVCEGEMIDNSNADIARDLRLLVRERLVAGDSDEEVKDYIAERYGEYVLMRPRFNKRNLALWAGPFALLLIGGGLAIFFVRRQRDEAAAASEPLTAEEQAELARVLEAEARPN